MITRQEIISEIARLDRDDPIDPNTAKRFTWPFRRIMLRNKIMATHGNLNGFLTWPTVKEALFAGATMRSIAEYDSLKSSRMRLAAIDPPVGGPRMGQVPLTNAGASGTYIRQAAICQLLEGFTGKKTNEWESMFEFGGGYGAMAVVSSRLGFNGVHTIFDFPELSLIQRWYLDELDVVGITHRNELAAFDKDTNYQMFVASCSLDEAPEDVRRNILTNVNATYYLIWYTKKMLEEEGWFEKFFWEEYRVRPIDIEIPGMNPNQEILFVDMNMSYKHD